MMTAGTDILDTAERAQFREAFHDNLDLILDMLEAMRCESTYAAEPTAALFLGGIQQALNAFGRMRGSVQAPDSLQDNRPEPCRDDRM